MGWTAFPNSHSDSWNLPDLPNQCRQKTIFSMSAAKATLQIYKFSIITRLSSIFSWAGSSNHNTNPCSNKSARLARPSTPRWLPLTAWSTMRIGATSYQKWRWMICSKKPDNLLLNPQKIDLTAYYQSFFADYLLLSLKKFDLAADNRK